MDFRENVRATLLYFDLFDHPLSRDELYTFLPEKMDPIDFDRMLLEHSFRSADGLFHARESDELVSIRRNREKKATRMLQASRMIGILLRCFPFVRAAFLSGSLSKGVNAGDADVDLFIVSAEERLWICRTFLIAFKKIFLLNNKRYLCPNYFVTEGHLEIPEKNIFTATELITLRPLFNARKLQDLLDANRWVLRFYPNFQMGHAKPEETRSQIQYLLELPMSDGYTANWDARLMHYFKGVWGRRYPDHPASEMDFLFRTTPYSSKIHPNDFQTKVLNAYERRLREEKLERLTQLDE